MHPRAPDTASEEPVLPPTETGLADVVTLQRRAAATVTDGGADAFFQDTLMEYLWARDVAGLAPTTLHRQVQPVVEVCDFYDLPPWQITPRHLDQYFAGVGKRATSTLRGLSSERPWLACGGNRVSRPSQALITQLTDGHCRRIRDENPARQPRVCPSDLSLLPSVTVATMGYHRM